MVNQKEVTVITICWKEELDYYWNTIYTSTVGTSHLIWPIYLDFHPIMKVTWHGLFLMLQCCSSHYCTFHLSLLSCGFPTRDIWSFSDTISCYGFPVIGALLVSDCVWNAILVTCANLVTWNKIEKQARDNARLMGYYYV